MFVSTHTHTHIQRSDDTVVFTCVTLSTAAEPAHPVGAARKRPDHHGPQQAERYAAAQVSLLVFSPYYLLRHFFIKK